VEIVPLQMTAGGLAEALAEVLVEIHRMQLMDRTGAEGEVLHA
jgi:hypothetical protein